MQAFLLFNIIALFFLLPFEGARFVFFGIPIYFIELAVTFFATSILLAKNTSLSQKSQKKSVFVFPPSAINTGILLLLGGVITSILAAHSESAICPLSPESFLRALGIFKSWFLFPLLFGYSMYLASQRYFSRENVIFLFAVSFSPFGIYSLLMWLFGSGMTYDGRFESIFNSPNAFALFLTPATILSWYFFRTRKTFLWLAYTAMFFILLFSTHSFSAWIATFIAILSLEVVQHRITFKRLASVLSIATIFISMVAFSQRNTPRFEHFFNLDSRSSFASRVMIWKSAEKMLIDSPIFGVGPGNFQSCYLVYQQYFPPYLEWSVPEPHNIFLAFWLGSGVVGLISFCILIILWFRNTLRIYTKTENPSVLLTLMAIMLALIIHGLFDTPYWRMSLAYIFWIIFFLGILPERKALFDCTAERGCSLRTVFQKKLFFCGFRSEHAKTGKKTISSEKQPPHNL
ncbi:MAG: O-antigen ligase family protein [Candidatus Moraniibacteriota bacterium]